MRTCVSLHFPPRLPPTAGAFNAAASPWYMRLLMWLMHSCFMIVTSAPYDCSMLSADSSITIAKQGGVLCVHQLHGSLPHQLGRLRPHRPSQPCVVDGALINVELFPHFQLLPTQLLTDLFALNAVSRQHSVVDDEPRQSVDHEADSEWGLEAKLLPCPIIADVQVSRADTRSVHLGMYTMYGAAVRASNHLQHIGHNGEIRQHQLIVIFSRRRWGSARSDSVSFRSDAVRSCSSLNGGGCSTSENHKH